MSKLPGEWKEEKRGNLRYRDSDGFTAFVYGLKDRDWMHWWVSKKWSRQPLKHHGPLTFEQAKEEAETELKRRRKGEGLK